MRLFELTGKEIRQVKKPGVKLVAFSADGNILAGGGSNSKKNNQAASDAAQNK